MHTYHAACPCPGCRAERAARDWNIVIEPPKWLKVLAFGALVLAVLSVAAMSGATALGG